MLDRLPGSGRLKGLLTVNLLMRHSGNQGGRPKGQMVENPAITHVRLSRRTKHLLYHMKPRNETVDSYVYRLLVASGGNLALSGYQPDNTGLFFKRASPDRLISETAAALDKRINSNHHKVKSYSVKSSKARHNHSESWQQKKSW